MKRAKKSRPRPNATAALEYVQLEYRMVLNGDIGWVVLAENTQFDDQGRLLLQELTFDFDDDQVADLRTIDQYQYNADGLTTNYLHQEDNGADGVVDSQFWNEQELTVDGRLLVSLDAWDNDGDGQRDSQIRSTWTYNEDNNPIHLLMETDVDGDGTFDESYEETFDPGVGGDGGWVIIVDESRYDEQGRITFQDITFDTDGDGVGDYRTFDEYEYNADGLTTSHLHQEDNGADGVVDSQYWSEQEYAEDGRLLVSLEAWDNDGDGQRDSQIRSTWTYDEDNNPIHLLTETDVDGDGTYDESYEENFDPSGGGSTGSDYRIETQETYDESGQLIRTTYTHFEDGDDVADSVEIISWTYQDVGLVDATTYEADNDADGVVDYRSISTNEYDVDSALIAIHYQVDENADGVFESSYTVDAYAMQSGTNGGEIRDYPTSELTPGGSTTDESTGRTSLNVAAISSFSTDKSTSLQSKKAASESDAAKLNGSEAGDSLQLAGSLVFDAELTNNAVRDDAFASMGSEGSDIFDEDATSTLFGSIVGDIDRL